MIWPYLLPGLASYAPTISHSLSPTPVVRWLSFLCQDSGHHFCLSSLGSWLQPLETCSSLLCTPPHPHSLLQVPLRACLPGLPETLHLTEFLSGPTSSFRPASLWMRASCVYFFPCVSSPGQSLPQGRDSLNSCSLMMQLGFKVVLRVLCFHLYPLESTIQVSTNFGSSVMLKKLLSYF